MPILFGERSLHHALTEYLSPFTKSEIIRDLRMSSLSLTNQLFVTKGPFTNPNASADCLTSISAPPDRLPSGIALISVAWHKPQRCLSIASRFHGAWPLFVTPSPTTEPRPYPDFVQTYFLIRALARGEESQEARH